VESRKLGPVVGLGTYRTFEGDVRLAQEVVAAALDAGVRLFDSSPMYGAAESSLGSALRERRGEVTIATKIWTPRIDEGRQQYEAQLRYFGRVDVEQVHNLVAWQEHLEWIEEERDGGRIDRIGVTHWSAGSFDELETALETGRFDTVQIPLNPLERDAERRILPLAEEKGIAVIVMRPFGGTGAPLLHHDPAAADLEPLRELGVETWGQALLAWVLADTRVDAVIPATSRQERVLENASAGSVAPLPPELRVLVERLAQS
jgi:diketogulonate reductase-like aldo/keto reductase